MLVSVIMPCYNVQNYISGALYSLQKQTYKDLEIICIDDASDDDTYCKLREAAELDSRIKLYKNEKNLGVVNTLNKLVEMATAEYIVRMDSDDFFEPERIERLVNCIINNGLDLVSSNYSLMDEAGNRVKKRGMLLPTLQLSIKYMACFNSPFPSQAMFAKKWLLKYPFSTKYRIAEDYYWFTKVIARPEVKVRNLSEELYRYRINSKGLSCKNQKEMSENHVSIAREYISALLELDTSQFNFWNLSKKMINPVTLSKSEIRNSLDQILKIRKIFINKFLPSRAELSEINEYTCQYMAFTYYCLIRDSKYSLRLIKIILSHYIANKKTLVPGKMISWILRNL